MKRLWLWLSLFLLLSACSPRDTISSSPTVPAPLPASPQAEPQVRLFETLSAEQRECLQRHWDEESFQAITTYQRPPTAEEEEAFQACGIVPAPANAPREGAPPASGADAQQQPSSPEGKPPAGDLIAQLGPAGHQIMLATSEDGLTWTLSDQPIQDAGSVPELIRLPNGEMLLYFVDGQKPPPSTTPPLLGVLRGSPADGWERATLTLEGSGLFVLVDPDAVLLPDGRIRLFYLDGIADDQGEARAVYSALSADGLHFVQEEGVRIALPQITDPSVVQCPDGSWLMALSQGSTTLLASSEEGEVFALTGVSVQLGGVPELTLLPDGTLRLFVSASDGIRSLRSTDGGRHWMEEDGLRIPAERGNVAADPSVIRLSDGRWLMAWKRLNPALLP